MENILQPSAIIWAFETTEFPKKAILIYLLTWLIISVFVYAVIPIIRRSF